MNAIDRLSTKIILIILPFLSIFIGCSKDVVTSSPTTGTISGTVIDSNGTGVSGALISSSPASSQLLSDATGSYTLPDLTPGFYTVTASKEPTGTGSAAVNVVAGKTTTAIIRLNPAPLTTGILVGTVTDTGGVGIAGADVTTVPATSAVQTDAGGHFAISNVQAGSYSVRASKTGFSTSSKSTVVAIGQTSTVTLILSGVGDIPTDGLLVYYPFDGDGHDASGNGRDLDLTSATFGVSRSGQKQALLCNGGSTVATAQPDEEMNSSTLTVSLWIKAPNPSANGNFSIIDKYLGNSFNGYTLWLTSNNIEWLYGTGSSFAFTVIDRSSVLDNGWHSIVCTADGNKVTMYFDGAIAASGTWSGNPGRTTQQRGLLIGAGTTSDNMVSGFFQGAIDDVRIYNRVLSASEISTLAKEQ
ncbi:MAG: carboxypeptidase regulatory-like domain-containing protein [Bacteroidetes bacterium]|nr:carboxypeptidase regulatory-like domain-containing protein [Bacteroidota bacterium]